IISALTANSRIAMRYPTILLDLDHTLLDSDASEKAAFEQTLRAVGVQEPAAYVDDYRRINLALWKRVEHGELRPQDVRNLRFEALIKERNINADAADMADRFVHGLGANGNLYDGALLLLQSLSESASLALVTNGLSEVQRARIARTGIEMFFDAIVISGEVGTAKPGTDIFDITFEALGTPDKAGALMVGDSLSSDIQGGVNYGIDTCWYNPHGKPLDRPELVTHEILTLKDLLKVVL
ncbi:MAG: YjjG family noncanonical pyrimidine nucleotidase, partial [Pseudomonadota bacterium]